LKRCMSLLFAALFLIVPCFLRAADYYVDAQRGDDASSGRSPARAWRSLDKINHSQFHGGDRILLRAGSCWHGQLVVSSSGVAGSPIRIDRYGVGALPRIDGEGKVENTLEIQNVQQVEVRHLELTNLGASPGVRRAVLIAAVDFGIAHHIVVADLYLHDVNGANTLKETGGILFRTRNDRVPSRFDDLRIERNIIWKVDRSAIAGQSNEISRSKWFPSLRVVIRDNFAGDIGGDGIVPWATDGALVEHNIALRCNQRAQSYNAGIWPWSTDNSLFELNEAAFTHSTLDGEGFDSDYNSRNSRFVYNYSHDNDGGFMLICTPVERNEKENIGNTGTVVAYNISHNDHERIFNLSGADRTTVEHNAIYNDLPLDVQVLLVSQWNGWSTDAIFRDNTFDFAGTGRYGHEAKRNQDGSYQIAPGWGGAHGIEFTGNRYYGRHVDQPSDPKQYVDRRFHPSGRNWNEPLFDPSHPEEFEAYLTRHRQWMIHLFRAEFGRYQAAAVPRPMACGAFNAELPGRCSSPAQ